MHSPDPHAERPAKLPLPEQLTSTPAQRLFQPLASFLEIQSGSGILLVICTVVALILANSPWAHVWEAFWHTEVGIRVGEWRLENSLVHAINDGLMTVFFFLVGLEIKREMIDGELRSPRQAALPIVAAIGGMLVPAGIYLAIQGGDTGRNGWGIPMATDIAFAVGILTLLGNRVPPGLKIFLLALAIVDDIGAIVIIALFYSTSVQVTFLGAAAAGLVLVLLMNRAGVRSVAMYTIVGILIWLAMFYSGIHPTVAGVILGLVTPGRAWVPRESLSDFLAHALDRLDGQVDRQQAVARLTLTARETLSPLERLEHALHAWVAFFIMPIFALANAGVPLKLESAISGVAVAVTAGLVVGKPLGILGFSWLAVRLGITQLPTGATWKTMFGTACLGGIGFTMSLFIAGLALEGELLASGKIGTLIGSAVSGGVGFLALASMLAKSRGDAEEGDRA